MDLIKVPDLAALIGPVIAAVVTALIVWLREILARRDEDFRRRETLATATQEVHFIQAWIAASRELNAEGTSSWVNEQVGADLAHAYALVAQVRPTDASRGRERPSLREVTSAVLLWGRLASSWARAGLIVYYLLLACVLFLSVIYLIPNSESSEPYYFLGVFVIMFLWVGLTWLWRSFLLWVDRRHRTASKTIPPNEPVASATSANEAIQVLAGGVWRQGVLSEWRPNGVSWAGRVRFDDGTVTDWVPAEHLRRISEPHVDA